MPQDEQFATNAPRLDVEKRLDKATPHAAPKSAAS
jgi:methionyl-tRNA formyltransferase